MTAWTNLTSAYDKCQMIELMKVLTGSEMTKVFFSPCSLRAPPARGGAAVIRIVRRYDDIFLEMMMMSTLMIIIAIMRMLMVVTSGGNSFVLETTKWNSSKKTYFFADRRSYLLEGQRASVKWMSGDGKRCDLSSNQRCWQRRLDLSLSDVRSYHHDSTCDFMCSPLISAWNDVIN